MITVRSTNSEYVYLSHSYYKFSTRYDDLNRAHSYRYGDYLSAPGRPADAGSEEGKIKLLEKW